MLQRIRKFTDRLLQIDSAYMITNGFWLSFGKIMSMLVLLFLSVAYAKYLTKDVYGEFRYVMSAMGMFSIITLPGLATSVMRSVARGYEGTFRDAAWRMFFISFGMTVVGFGFAFFYFFFPQNISLAFGFVVAAALAPLVEGLGTWRAYLDGKKEFKQKALRNISGNIFYGLLMATALAAIYYGHASINISLAILLGASYIGHGLPNIIYSIKSLRNIPANAPTEPGSLTYGYHLTLLDIIPNVAYNIDAILLFNFLGPSTLAVYSFAIAPIEQIRTLFDLVLTMVFPKIAMKTKNAETTDKLKGAIRVKVLRSLPVTAAAVLAYILAAPVLYHYLFPAYTESILPSQILALSLIFFPLNISTSALKAEGNIKKLFIISTIPPVAKIAAFLVFVPLYGLWGAVAVRVAGIILNYFLAFFLFQKKLAMI